MQSLVLAGLPQWPSWEESGSELSKCPLPKAGELSRWTPESSGAPRHHLPLSGRSSSSGMMNCWPSRLWPKNTVPQLDQQLSQDHSAWAARRLFLWQDLMDLDLDIFWTAFLLAPMSPAIFFCSYHWVTRQQVDGSPCPSKDLVISWLYCRAVTLLFKIIWSVVAIPELEDSWCDLQYMHRRWVALMKRKPRTQRALSLSNKHHYYKN